VNTSDKSINEFMHKPNNHDFVKYRNISLRSDDEESKSSNYNVSLYLILIFSVLITIYFYNLDF
jgi:hypothetical protein